MTTAELEIWKRLNECECVKTVREQWVKGDRYISLFDGDFGLIENDGGISLGDPDIWIPHFYDHIRPERSLWGMAGDIRWNWSEQKKIEFVLSDRPDLAIAKAIIEQEEK